MMTDIFSLFYAFITFTINIEILQKSKEKKADMTFKTFTYFLRYLLR